MDTLQSTIPLRPRGKEDWEHHKETICHLYHELGNPLWEVSNIMQSKHNFIRTHRQYKYRLKKWGFRKNLNTAELDEIQQCAATGRELLLPRVNGREIGSKRLKTFVAVDKQRRNARHYAAAPLRLGVNHISDSLRMAEMDLHAAVTHTRHQCEAASEKTWLHPATSASGNWYHDMLLAILSLRGKSEVDKCFQLIDKCCASYKTVMQAGDPLLLCSTYCSILELSEVGMDLAIVFARFVAGICTIDEGRTHPLTVLLTSMVKAPVKSAYNRHNVIRVVDAQFDILIDMYEEAWDKLWLIYLRLVLRRLTATGGTTQRQAVVSSNTTVPPELTQRGRIDPWKERELVTWVQIYKGITYMVRGELMRSSLILNDKRYSDASCWPPATRPPTNIRDLRAGIEEMLIPYTSTEKFYNFTLATILADGQKASYTPVDDDSRKGNTTASAMAE